MLEYIVCGNGGADFSTVSEAIGAVPEDVPAHIFIKNGIYREKIYCEKQALILTGESRDGTIFVWGDGAYHTHADGKKIGTFRSYTAFFSGGYVKVENLTIINNAGDGKTNGQAVAVAVDAQQACFYDVTLLSCQDTLFTGPLPEFEREPDGFLGPKQNTPRLASKQYYKNCYIRGDVDFIFGGADALFEDCTLHCHNRKEPINGYIAAPSTPKGGMGYLFFHCIVKSGSAEPGSFFLARPWRNTGRAVWIACMLGDVIGTAGFDDWGDAKNRETCFFAEYANTGKGAQGPRAFGALLDEQEAQFLLQRAMPLRNLMYDTPQ